MPASVVPSTRKFRDIGQKVTDMIKRHSNPIMQFIVGPVSPVTWTVVLLIAVLFWS